MNQALMMTSGGVQLYSTPMVLAIVGYALAWVLVCFLTWVSYRLCAWNNRVWPAAVIRGCAAVELRAAIRAHPQG